MPECTVQNKGSAIPVWVIPTGWTIGLLLLIVLGVRAVSGTEVLSSHTEAISPGVLVTDITQARQPETASTVRVACVHYAYEIEEADGWPSEFAGQTVAWHNPKFILASSAEKHSWCCI
ncbi:MAG: hypothetical protein AAF215_13840 [Cyanobacteria bacterium P01_A01_bin.123]